PPGNTSNSSPSTSVSEVLQDCSEDAEETLFQLGFGHDMPQPPARVPPRFFTFHSQLQGINFRLFLQSQLQRIQEEDPNLSIASKTTAVNCAVKRCC
uniref:ITPR-interacting domain-containing protein n=1 Tax=Gadus morhua TaxID=8049 RepID=A0A8C4YXE4_GADMO